MSRYLILWQIILADFRERTRRYSYLITLMVALFVGYLVLTGKYSYVFGPFMPVYNSAWVGTTVALAGAAMFALMGFYIVRTSISRDRDTRVGEILATTCLSNRSYLLAKFASNLMVLWSMVAALAVAAFIGMIARIPFEDVNIAEFLLPFILFPMVTTVLAAGAAVLFDTARWLRRTVGNVLYFFVAEFMIVSGIFGIPYIDAAGIGLLEASVDNAIHAVYPGAKVPMAIGFVGIFEDGTAVAAKSFLWNGLEWTLTLVLSRFIWPTIGLLMLALALLFFDRFEQSKRVTKRNKEGKKTKKQISPKQVSSPLKPRPSYRSIPPVKQSFTIVPMIIAELQLSLKQLRLVWYLLGLALILGQLFAPFEISRMYLVPAAMIWPLVLWSSMGTREARFNMRSLMLCSAGVQTRQYVALLFSGILIAITLCLPMVFRAIMLGELSYSSILLAAAILLPAAAFALGVVSGSRKLFEISYLMIWYAGSVNHLAPADLLGTTEESSGSFRAVAFVAIALGAALVAYIGRRKRLA